MKKTTWRLETREHEQAPFFNFYGKQIEEFLYSDVQARISQFEKRIFYKVSFESEDIDEKEQLLKTVFCDEVIQDILFSKENDHLEYQFAIEIGFKPGVTDNPGKAAEEALLNFGVKASVATGELYLISINKTKEELTKMAAQLLANNLIQDIQVYPIDEFIKTNRFDLVKMPTVLLEGGGKIETFNLDSIDEERFNKLNTERCLAMTWDEFLHVKDHYKNNLNGREITDVELEVIAQSWSEHCKHKIFGANIEFQDDRETKNINGLYKTFIKGSTKRIEKERNINWLKSVFSDNAGVVRFDENVDVCVKVETHNSPSALDPYGGSLTGILGVNRDILGTGMGAKPIANMDVFCFAPIEYPLKGSEKLMPSGLLNPQQLLDGVHKGVVDGGNKSGIPTVNGSIFFDPSYAGKPLVYVGTVGVMPQKLNSGKDAFKKYTAVGDRVVVVGGAVGADGIHGATFSSLELNENSPSTAVQIGDPLTQKRVTDFLIEAREQELFSAVTDNGAGGLSSSIGEMAVVTGGATIDLAKCPLKYPGLLPYEIMISESQERMSFAVPPKNIVQFLSLAKEFGVEATDLGEFNDSGDLKVFYQDKLVAELNLHFLHDSLPPMELKARWDNPRPQENWYKADEKSKAPEDYNQILHTLLSCSNIASKEKYVRQYDHEVQAATLVKPLENNSGVIWMKPHGGEEDKALSIGCGMAPRMSYLDPELMAMYAVDEAVRNVVSTGGDIDHLCLLDNFCWPDPVQAENNPDGEYKLGALVKTCQGLDTICSVYGTPLVSGKDSMKNDFKGKNKLGESLKISVLPTLLVTAVSKTQVKGVMTSDFKKSGDSIYHLGDPLLSLSAGEFANQYKIDDMTIPMRPNLEKNHKLYQKLHEVLNLNGDQSIINSVHDLSDGGLITGIAESCLSGKKGAEIHIENESFTELFGEGTGQFIISIVSNKEKEFEQLFKGFAFKRIGEVTSQDKLIVKANNKELIHSSLSDMMDSFTSAFKAKVN